MPYPYTHNVTRYARSTKGEEVMTGRVHKTVQPENRSAKWCRTGKRVGVLTVSEFEFLDAMHVTRGQASARHITTLSSLNLPGATKQAWKLRKVGFIRTTNESRIEQELGGGAVRGRDLEYQLTPLGEWVFAEALFRMDQDVAILEGEMNRIGRKPSLRWVQEALECGASKGRVLCASVWDELRLRELEVAV